MYFEFLKNDKNVSLIREIKNAKSNYWLNSVLLENEKARDEFLTFTNENGIMTRPIWTLMNKLEMFKNCPKADLTNCEWLEDRIVNITSSVRI